MLIIVVVSPPSFHVLPANDVDVALVVVQFLNEALT